MLWNGGLRLPTPTNQPDGFLVSIIPVSNRPVVLVIFRFLEARREGYMSCLGPKVWVILPV